jgi:hypothetical protein
MVIAQIIQEERVGFVERKCYPRSPVASTLLMLLQVLEWQIALRISQPVECQTTSSSVREAAVME